MNAPSRGAYAGGQAQCEGKVGMDGRMVDRKAGADQVRAEHSVTQCQLELWHARENALRAAYMFRRAARAVDEAERSLADATLRAGRAGMPPGATDAGGPSRRLAILR